MNKKTIFIALGVILLVGVVFLLKQGRVFFSNSQEHLYFSKNSSITAKEAYASNQKCQFSLFKRDKETLMYEPKFKKEVICAFSIHESLSEYIFRITGKVGTNEIESVEILKESSTSILQTFNDFLTYPVDERLFELQDINFDGYMDARTLVDWGTIGCAGYDYWIFNPSNALFDKTHYLGGCNPKPNPATKEVEVDNFQEGRKEFYRWINRELVRVP